jgi:hypothetical protein
MKRIAIFPHELAADFNLFVHFRIVRREQVAFRSFDREDVVTFLDLEPIQKFLGKNNSGRGSDGTQFEFHGVAQI